MNTLRAAHRIGLQGSSTCRRVLYRYGQPAHRGFVSTALARASLSNYDVGLTHPPPAPLSTSSHSPSSSKDGAPPSTGDGASPPGDSGGPAPSPGAAAATRPSGSAALINMSFHRDLDVALAAIKDLIVKLQAAVALTQQRTKALENEQQELIKTFKAHQSRVEEQRTESGKAHADHRRHARKERSKDRKAINSLQDRQDEAVSATDALHKSMEDLRASLFDFVLHTKSLDDLRSRTLARLEPAPVKERVANHSAAVEKAVMAKLNAEKGLRLSEQMVEEAALKPARALKERVVTAIFWLSTPVFFIFGLAAHALPIGEEAANGVVSAGGGTASGGAGGASSSGVRPAGSAAAPSSSTTSTQSWTLKDAAMASSALAAAPVAERAARAAADKAKSSKAVPPSGSASHRSHSSVDSSAYATRRFLAYTLPAKLEKGLDTALPIERVIRDLRDHALLTADRQTAAEVKKWEDQLVRLLAYVRSRDEPLTLRRYLNASAALPELCLLHRIVAWNMAHGKRDYALQALTVQQRRNLRLSRAFRFGRTRDDALLELSLRALDRPAALARARAPQT